MVEVATKPVLLPTRRVHRMLRGRLLGGQYRPGERLPTEKEFGSEFGVSRLTVAKAMAQLVNEGLVNRYRGRGSFVSSKLGANGTSHETRPRTRITFISPGTGTGPVMLRRGVLEGLHAVMAPAGYDVAVDFYDNIGEHLKCLDKYMEPQSAGFVIWPMPDEPARQRVAELLRDGFPSLLVDTYWPGMECDYVVSDNMGGASELVRHLVQQGHERIVYITEGLDRTSVKDRMSGFIRGAVYAGLANDAFTVEMTRSLEREDVADAVKRAMERRPRPTAICCSHDTIAISAYWALREMGLSVPGDVSLAGYDDIDMAEHFAVPLTSVSQNFFEMGSCAGRILLERLRSGRPSVYYQKQIQPELKIRQSTGPADGKDSGGASPAGRGQNGRINVAAMQP